MKNMNEETKQDEQKIVFTTCPCCGKPTLPETPKLPENVMDVYLASVLTGVPFSMTYPLYGGRVNITCRTLSRDLEIELRYALSILERLGAVADDASTKVAADNAISLMKTFAMIESISIRTQDTAKTLTPACVVEGFIKSLVDIKDVTSLSSQDCRDLILRIKRDLSNPDLVSGLPQEVLFSASAVHRNVDTIAVNSGFDSDFWARIKLA